MDENSIKKFFVTRIECRAISCDFSELQTNGCFVYHVKILVLLYLLYLLTLVLHTECTPINRIRNLYCSKYQVLCFFQFVSEDSGKKSCLKLIWSRGQEYRWNREKRVEYFLTVFILSFVSFLCSHKANSYSFAHFFFLVGGICGIEILVYGFMKLPMCLLSKPWMYYSVRVVLHIHLSILDKFIFRRLEKEMSICFYTTLYYRIGQTKKNLFQITTTYILAFLH